MLVVEGARGCGKTALIDALARQLDQRVPYARISFAQHRAATVPEVLSAIAFQLGRTCDGYGSLQFPLLTVGRQVMRADLPDGRAEARAAVQHLLTEQVNLETMRTILFDTAGVLTDALPPDNPVNIVARLALKLGPEAILQAVRRSKALSPDWYGHRDRGLLNNPYDVLVDLNTWVKDDMTFQINELLWDAFLADLRDCFQTASYAPGMTLNCVVLLDDADIPLGQEFVTGVVDARKRRPVLGADPADPMTVVATSYGALLSGLRTRELVEFTGRETDGELSHDREGEPHWWCRYKLPDLGRAETAAMVSARSPNSDRNMPLISNHQLTSMVYGLAGGHPASTALLVATMRERPLEHGETLAVLLDHPVPGREPNRPALAEAIRQQLIGEFTEDTYDDLITCAAARTKQHASLLATRGELLVGGINGYREIAPVLWPASGGAGPAVLRRLLLRQLAARTSDEAVDWTKVFGWLQIRCAQDGDEEGVLHYAMAAEDISTVSEGLRQRLTTDEPADWVRLLHSVTAAPRRPDGCDVAPMDQLRESIDKRSQRLTRLIVGRWIVFDPLISNRRRSLHRQIAADYEFLAGLSQVVDPEPLLNEADHHRKQAELWS